MPTKKNPDYAVFADNLRYYIEVSGKRQLDVAIDLDIGKTTLNNWVMGLSMPSWTTIQRLAAYFKILPQMLTEKGCVLDKQQQLSIITRDMTDEQFNRLLSYAEFLLKEGE